MGDRNHEEEGWREEEIVVNSLRERLMKRWSPMIRVKDGQQRARRWRMWEVKKQENGSRGILEKSDDLAPNLELTSSSVFMWWGNSEEWEQWHLVPGQSSVCQELPSRYRLGKLQRVAWFSWAIWVKGKKTESWVRKDLEGRGVLLAKGGKANWIVYRHQVGFEPICLKAKFPQSFPNLNTAYMVTYLICLNRRPSVWK